MATENAETKVILKKFGEEEIEVLYRKALPPEEQPNLFPPLNPSVSEQDGIRIERDASMQLRDGATIYFDVFRPVGVEKVPAIISWSFASKNYTFKTRKGGTYNLVPDGAVSSLAKQEGPDPGYWCHFGYAIINVDSRGVGNSDGDIHFLGTSEANDCYDFIEWLAEQPWCTGKIAMYGTAWQGNTAWVAAAAQPPHLTCIAPTEAFYSFYNSMLTRGGVLDSGIVEHVMTRPHGHGYIEDVVAMARKYPLMNAYWADKTAKVENINIPVYISGNVNMFHCDALDAYRKIPTEKKWLRTHDTISWRDVYYPDNVSELHRFFDRYLKDIYNGWEFTPHVRLSIYDTKGDIVNRPENEWPPVRAQHRPLYLNAEDGTIAENPVKVEASVRYHSESAEKAQFVYTFDRDTEVTGYGKLRLWVEADGSEDMDLFVSIEQLDAKGNMIQLPYFDQPHGSNSGILRVSHRELDPSRSTPSEPYLPHRTSKLLKKGEIVPVEIPLWPFSYVWHKGEQLRITVKGWTTQTGPAAKSISSLNWESVNRGDHIIHTGGQYDSFLLLPIIQD